MAASGEVSGEFFRPRRNRECGWIDLKLASGPADSRPPLDAGWPAWLADALGRGAHKPGQQTGAAPDEGFLRELLRGVRDPLVRRWLERLLPASLGH